MHFLKPSITDKRRPYVAALLSLLAPGLGHIYAGFPTLGASILVAWLAMWLSLGTIVRLSTSSWSHWVVVFVMFSVPLGAIVDAIRRARCQRHYELKSYNRWYVYLLICIFVFSVFNVFASYQSKIFGYEIYRNRSGGMIPMIFAGDYVLVDTKRYEKSLPARNDVVAFRYPLDRDSSYIHRIIGIPGDKIEYLGKRLSINGQNRVVDPLGPYLYLMPDNNQISAHERFTEHAGESTHQILLNPEAPPIFLRYVNSFPNKDSCQYSEAGVSCTVPNNLYFVMGDNRDGSLDSRYFGYIPARDIVGQVVSVLINDERLGRIGEPVK